jgi:hypothetical protein
VFFPAADTVAVSTNGVERTRIDSSGNVVIGTTNTGYGNFAVYNASNALIALANSTSYAQLQQNGADLYINTNVNGSAGGNTIFRNGAPLVERMRIDSSGNLLVGITSARANAGDVQVSKGISFPATQSAQSDANTLDDYEEGTFTPTQANFTVTGTPTLTGRYTKIGRFIHFSATFNSTGTIAHSASALITIPFAGLQNSGNITMRLSSTSSAFNNNQSGAQCTSDEVSFTRFFVGSFTTTSTGQSLIFAGTYEVA